jgi:hypothetical protein
MSDNYLTKQEQIEAKAGLIRIILKTQDILERLRDDEDEILTKEEAEAGFEQIDEKLTALEEALGIGEEETDEAEAASVEIKRDISGREYLPQGLLKKIRGER